jgi:predicted transcriptional regulator of viral defense system
MQTLAQKLINEGLENRVLTDKQLARVLKGSPQRRYGLVNRALKAGDLHRLTRGRYLLADRYRDYPGHPFALAQAFVPGSYVSFETALAYHGWIPEAVYTTACVTPGRKTLLFDPPGYGRFSFHPLAIHEGRFLELVLRTQITQQTMWIAEPLRALMDLVCLRKTPWQGLDWLTEGLRIDEDNLRSIKPSDIETLILVYKQKRVNSFLSSMTRALVEPPGHD